MAGVFNGKNTFTQPTNTNDTPTHRESNGFDSPLKNAFDALSAPGFGWSSSGLDCEWTYPPFEFNTGTTGHPSFLDGQMTCSEDSHNGTSPSGQEFVGHFPSSGRALDGDFFLSGPGFNFSCGVDHTQHDVQDLLEDDLAFRLATRNGGQYSSVRRGLQTNLAELQVAGDVLPTHSTLLEEEWSRLSTPALSVSSDLTDETSLPIPSTPPNDLSVVPAAVTVARDLIPSPPAEAPTLQEPGPPEESKVFDSPLAPEEHQFASKGKKRKRDAPELDDTRENHPKSLPHTDDEHWFKWFNIEGRSKSRHSTQSKVAVHTKYGESCCSRVGDAGYCQFEWNRNGKAEKCGIELIRDRDILTAHFTLHFEDLGYYTMAENNPEWRPRCPWCNEMATTFANFTRHVNYSELELNVTRCGCGGTINRGNQSRFRTRHEETKKHRDWVVQSRVGMAASEENEPNEEWVEFVEGNSRGTERRGSKVEVTHAAEKEDDVEGQEDFVEGSSADATRTRRKPSNSRNIKVVIKEEADEEQELIESRSTRATRKRRKAKKSEAEANEDPDEEQEEFVEGSSTGAKRRRLR